MKNTKKTAGKTATESVGVTEMQITKEEQEMEEVRQRDLFGSKVFEWSSKDGEYKQVKVRNVNNEIELSIESTKKGGKRTNYVSFVLPSTAFEEFVKAITTKFEPEVQHG